MPPVAKNKKFDNNIEIQNTSVDFNTLNQTEEEGINAYGTDHESESESDFFTDISEHDSSGSDFCSTTKIKLYPINLMQIIVKNIAKFELIYNAIHNYFSLFCQETSIICILDW